VPNTIWARRQGDRLRAVRGEAMSNSQRPRHPGDGDAFASGLSIPGWDGLLLLAGPEEVVVAAAPPLPEVVTAAQGIGPAQLASASSIRPPFAEQQDDLETATVTEQQNVTSAPVLLDPTTQPRFVNDLPLPDRIDASKSRTYTLEMRETTQWLGLIDSSGNALETTVWGFGQPGHDATYPGPTIVAYKGTPIRVNWQNRLPTDGHLLPVDTSLHMADPERWSLEEGAIPTVIHLHGGHTASSSDGLPDAWFTQHSRETGPAYQQQLFTYENDQQAATLWYHDHALGLTRLNVYAGLAGFYLLRDTNEQLLTIAGVLPGGRFEVEMAIQDRAFTADGQLYLPANGTDPIPGTDEIVADRLPEGFSSYPSVVPEFFGDFLLVNGMAWPKYDADPGQYRFRLLNGSDSRFYVLQLDNPDVAVTLVGVDGGLLLRAATIMDGDGVQEAGEQLVLAPGDRLDLVFDFSKVAGESATLLNVGPAFEPFKGLLPDGSLGGEVEPATPDEPVGAIMRFDVSNQTPMHNATVTGGTMVNPLFRELDEADAVRTRKLGLFEARDEFGRLEAMLGVAEQTVDINGNPVPFGPLGWDAPTTETPTQGSTEVWEIYNFTEDAHPIHLHLVSFQVLDKHLISFSDELDNGTLVYGPDGIPDDRSGDGVVRIGDDVIVGSEVPLAPEETGWQDTVWIGPGEVLRLAANFDLAGDYVWHCHILSHEDNEMMRPFTVLPS